MFRQRADGGRLIAAVLLAVSGITGCSHASKPDHGAFLTDYTKLQERKDAQSHVYFTHRVATPAPHDHTTYAISVSYFPADARFAGLGSEAQASILAYLDHAIRQRLQDKAMLTNGADQADIQLRVAITQVSATDPGMKPWDFLPVRLLMKPVKDGILGAPKVATAALEEQMLDARTNMVLNESVRKDVGGSIGRQKKGVNVITLQSLRTVLDLWASSVVSELTTERGQSCQATAPCPAAP
jgi:hypothetical protein